MITNGTTKRYVWDLRNRIAGIDSNNDGDTADVADVGDFNYAYDSDGVRISERVKSSTYSRTTYYLNDPDPPQKYLVT